ncbi:importin-7-like isoform X2 [Argonauta hians]
MDINELVEVLQATLDPARREQAEQKLHEVHKIAGFAPILMMQVVMSDDLEMPVRQAGVIYFKNMVMQFWHDREAEQVSDPLPFNIHEQDRDAIRNNIIESVIHTPDTISTQLCVCLSTMIKYDYPGRWPDLTEKISRYIQSEDHRTWMGALMCLYQLVKVYEYKRASDREILNQAMVVHLPLIYKMMLQIMPDPSIESNLLQKQILKIFYALIQNFLPLNLIDQDVFTRWMEVIRQIVDRAIPEAANQVDEEERPSLPWWKVKKWALHILARTFERYGSPGNVTKDYTEFANWYLKSFTCGIIPVLLNLLDQYRKKMYVAPRVIQQTLNYLNQGISHAFSWKCIKPHITVIIQDVVFPLMCHNNEDDELWATDPHEYIRMKFDMFEDFLSPVVAAQTLFHSAVGKRKEVLQQAIKFCMSVLMQPNVDPRQKDGALHMIGAVADILLKRKIYKDQAELMLTTHVFPEFSSQHGYLRARACWMLHYFSELRYKQDNNLMQALELSKKCLCNDNELPVKVEAAIALQMLVTQHDKAKQFVRPHIKPVILEVLRIIRETENDELTSVLQRLVCNYVEEVLPIAVEMMTHLAQTFHQLLNADIESSEDKVITALGVLNTMAAILDMMEGKKEMMVQLEGVVLNVVALILQQNIIDFYEEVLSLVCGLTSTQISPQMWQVFGMLYQMFQTDGIDYFTDMMPVLHNYVTVDTQSFLAQRDHLEAIYNMCSTVLFADIGEDAECHAAKLLEVILLQCKGQVDEVVPSFVELALKRLTKEVKTSELRTMCLQVVIAALYYNPPLLFETLQKIHLPNVTCSITSQFLNYWLGDIDCFLGLHDRKVSVLGLCSLMNTPGNRPNEITEIARHILPAVLLLFKGLKRAYASKAQELESDEEEDEELEDGEQDILESDEDEINEEGQEYIEKLEKSQQSDEDTDDDFTEDGADETALESYLTPLDDDDCLIDEYIVFKDILGSLQTSDPTWYSALTSALHDYQAKELEEVFRLSEQRRAAAESKRIEQSGGYVFANINVPASFNFGQMGP